MNKYLFSLILTFLWCSNLNSQVYQVLPLLNDGRVNFDVVESVQDGVGLNSVSIYVPEQKVRLLLHQVNLFSDDFFVETSSGQTMFEPEGTFYQGSVEGNSRSVASVSIVDKNLTMLFSTDDGNFEVVNDGRERYTVRQIPLVSHYSTECYTSDSLNIKDDYKGNLGTENITCRAVQIYFECDNNLFTKKGSVSNTVSYVTALFNQVSILYSNEQIAVQLSQIKVWDTPDPYIPFTTTSTVLNKFRTYVGTNFNGTLAHLLSGRSLGGGIAYVDVLCAKQYAFGVSAITTSFQNVPTYSWSVEVVTHELGHNIGSWHTHSCNWPQGALDNCVSPEGSCSPGPAPINGGTIMSYCHLTGYGINLNNGFGSIPGNYIRSKFNSATCLPGNNQVPTGLSTSNITQSGAKVSWNPSSGSVYYDLQYKKNSSTFWITLDSLQSTSMNFSGLTANTLYDWRVKNECSGYTATQQFMTLPIGGQCSVISTLSVGSITSNSAVVSWGAINGASSYVLQYKKSSDASWNEVTNITSLNFQIINLSATTQYQVKVRPNCNGTFSTEVVFTTTVGGTCPSPVDLKNEIIANGWVRISWKDPGVTQGWSIGIKLASMQTFFQLGSVNISTVVISGLQPNTTYNWRVKNQCSDWSYTMTFTTNNFLVPQSDGLISIQEDFKIYPNPAFDELQIFGTFSSYCRIFDSLGRLVAEKNIFEGKVDVSELKQGIYFLLVDDKKVKFIKI